MYFSTSGQSSRKRSCCSLVQKPITYSTPGAVVPTAVEDHDFARGREMLHVALHVHLRLLAVGRRGQRHEAEHARADALGDGLDGAAFAGGVAALEDDDHAQALVFDPFLKLAQLGLELAQFLLVFLRFIFLSRSVLNSCS